MCAQCSWQTWNPRIQTWEHETQSGIPRYGLPLKIKLLEGDRILQRGHFFYLQKDSKAKWDFFRHQHSYFWWSASCKMLIVWRAIIFSEWNRPHNRVQIRQNSLSKRGRISLRISAQLLPDNQWARWVLRPRLLWLKFWKPSPRQVVQVPHKRATAIHFWRL